ncbi:hypothetical protein [Ideonella sp. A 288]|uniref:hypothetical protein n=1 Tax=Ideonella sp. A 288 TaxID=1962181 RepID=UPI0011861E50|nr:hypothetical protein [Ideonella sp. A 288]
MSDTGLFEPGRAGQIRRGVVSYTPQYPLWTDGATKRRWLWLPPGRSIDASRPDAWVFPVGTRLWKEFAFAGRPVETRFIERCADGQWRFATYLWDADGRDARLAPERGIGALPVAGAPGGRHAVPARGDCLACHGDAPVPVLGVTALQLSPDRDPLAAHAEPLRDGDVDLRGLAARGWLRGLPPGLLRQPPRIAADSPAERAAVGYLHGNCGHCHHRAGTQVPLPLTLAQSVVDPKGSAAAVRASTVDAPSRYALQGGAAGAPIVAPGQPVASVLSIRMQSRQPLVQMPPLGTLAPDPEGLALVHRWIVQLNEHHRKETSP